MRPRFIDLFAGIGGIRLAFEQAGAVCVWANEIDRLCAVTYSANFASANLVVDDIRNVPSSSIPDFDILCAGFPCQPFSIAGITKKNSLGKPHGFDDPTAGTLFHEIVRILRDKRPSAYFLENVKHLLYHDKGQTFAIITDALEQLGYSVFYRVINANRVLPQNRERLYIVGFLDRTLAFAFPDMPNIFPKLRDILEPNVPDKYTLTASLWEYLQAYALKHRRLGNGFGFGLADIDRCSRTLSARYHKDGSEILIPQKGSRPRRLTPRECARLQGFPDSFILPVSDTQAYKQLGNSVPVPVVKIIAEAVLKTLRDKPVRTVPYTVQLTLGI